MNRVRVIGSGNAFAMDGRSHACYLIEDNLLLDIGASSIAKLNDLNVSLESLDALLLTHFHGDHYGGVPFLLLTFEYIHRRTRPFIISGAPGVESACNKIIDATYPGMKFGFPIEFKEIPPGQTSNLLNYTVHGFPITHKEESTGFRITWNEKTFAFSGDTSWDEHLFTLVNGVDLAIIELSLFENPGNDVAHVALSQVKSFTPKAKRIVYSHVFNELAHAAREFGLEIAEDGLRLEF